MEVKDEELDYKEQTQNSDNSFQFNDVDSHEEEDLDNYFNKLENQKKQESEEDKKLRKALQNSLVFITIFPMLLGCVLISFLTILACNRVIRDEGILVSSAVESTSMNFLKDIAESVTDRIMNHISPHLEEVHKIRNKVMMARSNQGKIYLDPGTGDYNPTFKAHVDRGEIDFECYSILNIIKNQSLIQKFQGCLILNHLYSTLKFWKDWGDDLKYKQYFSEFPSILIGLESGHGKTLFQNLSDPHDLRLLRELHPQLVYDLAIVQEMVPFFSAIGKAIFC